MWALPTPGGPDDFPRLLAGLTAAEPSGLLWTIRRKLGELLGWDDERKGLGGRVRSLRERLPADLRDGPRGPALAALPFEPLYLTGDEFAAEIANGTMHGVLHLGWVPDGDGWRGQMAVLVKPNGLLGDAYMEAIKPFRLLVVYPQLMRRIERDWPATAASLRSSPSGSWVRG